MDKIKIGKFIAECRKEKNLTQEELANLLGITNKSISKWENGISLPDASLYEELCCCLDITLNELFLGERIQDYHLLDLLKHKLYDSSDKSISFDEFNHALNKITEVSIILKKFDSKESAVSFLVNETSLPKDECEKAYDFYIQLFKGIDNER